MLMAQPAFHPSATPPTVWLWVVSVCSQSYLTTLAYIVTMADMILEIANYSEDAIYVKILTVFCENITKMSK